MLRTMVTLNKVLNNMEGHIFSFKTQVSGETEAKELS